MMNFGGIHHVGLVVSDLDAAIDFYGALLDMAVIERFEWSAPAAIQDQAIGLTGSAARGAMLSGSQSHLEVWEYSSPPAEATAPKSLGAHEQGLRHLALEVTDVAAALERVKELGGTAMGEPVQITGSTTTLVYCRDPFGTILELLSGGGPANPDDP